MHTQLFAKRSKLAYFFLRFLKFLPVSFFFYLPFICNVFFMVLSRFRHYLDNKFHTHASVSGRVAFTTKLVQISQILRVHNSNKPNVTQRPRLHSLSLSHSPVSSCRCHCPSKSAKATIIYGGLSHKVGQSVKSLSCCCWCCCRRCSNAQKGNHQIVS